ncbi:unnamed protein product [Prunus armeniaca]|uniref:Uncharacterized protein n=1 Tax=Prunus armeniaca TaxID=36596 RepID=A0A6J5UPS0_PRUAR|nr:unnamed protein product [Prunus armeniaca]CAB4308301.1 unnamed protein product [Prunus armeniaca]
MDRLLELDELYWWQRSRVNWLKSRDRNISYFHKIAHHRAKTNSLTGILDANNVLQKDRVPIGKVFLDYYNGLFSSAGVTMSSDIFEAVTT